MKQSTTELSRPLVVGQKRDGRNRYDEQAKRELIEACLEPGVSVARMPIAMTADDYEVLLPWNLAATAA